MSAEESVPPYNQRKPQDYILSAFQNVLALHPHLADEIGVSISIPKFASEIIEDLMDASIIALQAQPSLIRIQGPITLIGDIHGNFHDLIRIFGFNKYPPHTNYLFFGDLVDRGLFSIEVVVFVFALLCKYPENVYIIRGNHEFEAMNSLYGFRGEVLAEGYTEEIWTKINRTFDYLPIAAIVDNKYFCVHGGLSPQLNKVEDINAISKPLSDYADTIVSDLVWSDPDPVVNDYQFSLRGCGYKFGNEQIKTFLENNELEAIIRAHQCVMNGVEKFGKTELYTLFSCSNYCLCTENCSGYIQVDESSKMTSYKLPPLNISINKKVASFTTVPSLFIPQVLLQNVKLRCPPPVSSTIRLSKSVGTVGIQNFKQIIQKNDPVMIDFNEIVEVKRPLPQIPRPHILDPLTALTLAKGNMTSSSNQLQKTKAYSMSIKPKPTKRIRSLSFLSGRHSPG